MHSNVLPMFPEAAPVPRIVFGRAIVGSLVDRAAELTGIPRGNIVGPTKDLDTCLARFAVVRVSRDMGKSLPQIGRVLGGRDHSTIHSAYRRALDLERTDPDFALLVRLLRGHVIPEEVRG